LGIDFTLIFQQTLRLQVYRNDTSSRGGQTIHHVLQICFVKELNLALCDVEWVEINMNAFQNAVSLCKLLKAF
jgi:hypothetical protein